MNKEHTNAIPLNKQVIQGVDNTSRSIVDGVYRYRFCSISLQSIINVFGSLNLTPLTKTTTPELF